MVFHKIVRHFSRRDEDYRELYLNYSKLKVELKNLEDKKNKDIEKFREKVRVQVAKNLNILYLCFEEIDEFSHKIKSPDENVHKLLLEYNKANKKLKEIMKRFHLEEFDPTGKDFDDLSCEVLKEEIVSTERPNSILKTIRKGLKFEDKIFRKAKVVLNKQV